MSDRQVKNFTNNLKGRQEAIASDAKLQALEFLDWLNKLFEDDKNVIRVRVLKHRIAWHPVISKSLYRFQLLPQDSYWAKY